MMQYMLVLSVCCVITYVMLVYKWRGVARKGEAPLIWSWIPFLGDALAIMARPYEFFKTRFSAHGDVFTTVVGGHRMLFLRNPYAWNYVLKNHKLFNFEETIPQFLQDVFGAPADHMERFQAAAARKLHTRLLLSANALEDLTSAFQCHLHRVIRAETNSGCEYISTDLFQFIQKITFLASASAFFHPSVTTTACLDAFKCFDDKLVPLLGGALVPKRMVKDAIGARELLREHMLAIVQDPALLSACSEHAQQMAQLNLSTMTPEEHSVQMVAVLWASNGNTVPAVFWTLYELLRSGGEALAAVKRELAEVTARAAERQGVDAEKVMVQYSCKDLEEMKLLDSCVWETLRLYTHNAVVRAVTHDCDLPLSQPASDMSQPLPQQHDGVAQAVVSQQHSDMSLPVSQQSVKLRAADRVMMPVFVMHLNEEIYPEPFVFKHDRFLKSPEGKWPTFYWRGAALPFTPLFPFGGGIHMCPGRMLAINEMKLVTALMLQYCDISLPNGASADDAKVAPLKPDMSRVLTSVLPPLGAVPVKLRMKVEPQAETCA
eukprot:TRINITY_DN52_c0_g1_i1.p1 TRINITY_DN52_c0_g1~~TRINITY_DN52_c0_g1_i1.p1  ORF type:complete len:547 (+),score=120.02 TRINITY_DN52_c0_g1_i1:291-1931(+)